jgi:hypothetical protein
MCLNLGMKGKHLRSETTIQWDKTKTIDTIYHFILCTSKLKLKKKCIGSACSIIIRASPFTNTLLLV